MQIEAELTELPISPWNKGKRLPPEVLTEEEIQRLLNVCSKRAPTGIRNRALIAVLYRGQLRVSEALKLMSKDLDADQGTLRVLHGKGDKSRLVGLDDLAWAIILRWLDRRKELGLSRKRAVFCTLDGKPLQT